MSNRLTPERIIGYIGSISLLRLAVKFAGFGEKLTLTYYFNLEVLDAFTVALSVPLAAYFCVRSVTGPTILPMFLARLQRHDRTGAWAQIHSWALLLFIGFVPLGASSEFFIEPLAWLLAPGFDSSRHQLCLTMMQITVPMSLLMALAPLAEAALNATKAFNYPPLADLTLKASTIAVLFFFGQSFGAVAAACGAALGAVGALAVSAWGLRRSWCLRGSGPNFRDPDFRKVLLLMAAPGAGQLFSSLGTIVENAACSTLQPGSVIALELARKIVNMPLLVLPLATGAVLLTAFVELYQAQDNQGVANLLTGSLRTMLFFFLPLGLSTYLLSEPITALIYQRGEFNAQSTAQVAGIVSSLSPVMLLLSVEGIIMAFFYARQDLWRPVACSIAAVALRVLLIWALIGRWEMSAVAFAILISRFFALLTLLLVRLNVVNCRDFMVALAKMAPALLGMALVLKATMVYATPYLVHVTGWRLLQLATAAGAGFLTYGLLCYLMGCNECQYVISKLVRRRAPAATQSA